MSFYYRCCTCGEDLEHIFFVLVFPLSEPVNSILGSLEPILAAVGQRGGVHSLQVTTVGLTLTPRGNLEIPVKQ